MYQIGVSPSFLIGHVHFFGKAFKNEILGPERANKIDPLKSSYRNKLRPTIHSDYNITPIDPLRCVHNAVTRTLKF